MKTIILCVCGVVMFAAPLCAYDTETYATQEAVGAQGGTGITEVLDCNTLRLANGNVIRLIGLDCPKKSPAGQIEERVLAEDSVLGTADELSVAATAFVKELLERAVAHLEFDVQYKDDEGNILAYVFIEPRAGMSLAQYPGGVGVSRKKERSTVYWFANALILGSGHAVLNVRRPYAAYDGMLRDFFLRAIHGRRGMWSTVAVNEEYCDIARGRWGHFGGLQDKQCNLPTTDKNVFCRNGNECQGDCIAKLTDNERRQVEQGTAVEKAGRCSEWVFMSGCYPFVEGGAISGILCKE